MSKTEESAVAINSSLCTAPKKLQAKLSAYLAPARTELTATVRRLEGLQTEPHSNEQKPAGLMFRLTWPPSTHIRYSKHSAMLSSPGARAIICATCGFWL